MPLIRNIMRPGTPQTLSAAAPAKHLRPRLLHRLSVGLSVGALRCTRNLCPSGLVIMFCAVLLAGIPSGESTRAADRSAAVDETIDWQQVTAAAGWSPRDSQGELVFGDRLWILGGWMTSWEAPPRDVWSSSDGVHWQQVTKEAPWKHSDLSMSLTFGGRMWMMGGWYNGRLPGHSASNSVWSSEDGVHWKEETAQAGWSPRLAAGAVVFRDRMWILGGTENYYFGDGSSLRNDVWASSDGRVWQQMAKTAPWSPRAYHQAVVLNDRMYVLGGGNYVPEYHAVSDVWSSPDGRKWRQETSAAPWHPRLWFSSVAYRGFLWVLGGWSGDPSENHGDAWFSRDGKRWKQLRTRTQWKARHEHSAFVFDDALWIAGGHARPLTSDVWVLKLPPDWNGMTEDD